MSPAPVASNESLPLLPVNSSTPVVNANDWVVAALPELLIRTLSLDKAVLSPSNTLTWIPSIPSTVASVVGVTTKVVDDEPDAIVAVPDNTSISEVPALSTVPPLSSPITVHEKEVSEVTAVAAVIVKVTESPSSTLEADFVTVKEPPVPDDQAVPATVTLDAPSTDPEEGSVETPAPAAKPAKSDTEPVVPDVVLPPKSKLKLLAPLIVTIAPLLNVSWTASDANFVEATDNPLTNWIVFEPLVSTIVIAALAAMELERI